MAIIAVSLAGLLVALAGCAPKAAPPTVATAPAPVLNEFVGSEACAPCHVAEARDHGKAHHSHTLRPMTQTALGKSAPPVGLLPGTNAAIGLVGDAYQLEQPETGQTRPLEYAFGSGKQGLTFVAVGADNSVFEMRKSYIPRTHQWYTTPGQEANEGDPNVTGKRHRGSEAKNCMGCHTVTVSDFDISPEPKFMGVGCESCHGEGSLHIAAAKAGRLADLKMEKLEHIGGARMNSLCGRCHQTAESIQHLPARLRLTQRFMPYGLSLSACFRKSNDQLTCSTCHNPHRNAETSAKTYEKICLTCHSRGDSSAAIGHAANPAPPGFKRTVCPVNPRGGCIPCHMPRRQVFGGTKLPIAMSDHYIKINR